jgi:hypothetical protein
MENPCDSSFIRGAKAALVWPVAAVVADIVISVAVFMSGFLEDRVGHAVRFGHAQGIARRGGWCNFNVGEEFSVGPDAPAIAGRRAHAGFRNGERMPLICPTCQIAWSNAVGRLLLCMGLFSIF